MYEDKTLICKNCGKEFIFKEGEQAFYNDRGLAEPKHCPECRRTRKQKASEFHDKTRLNM